MAEPLVSVLLPCFNAERFLPGALGSILAQTHEDIEVLAIDDGSTDRTLEVLRGFGARDGRIRVLSNPENLGLIRTLNRGIDEARGEFIARMDADDESLSQRFQRQVGFLAQNPDVGAVSSAVEAMDEWGRGLRREPARCTEPESAHFMALLGTPLIHPALMVRAEYLRRFRYREERECLHVEDYDLFTRMLSGGVRLANSVEILHRYRISPASVSRSFEPVQIERFVGLARAFLRETTGLEVTPEVHRVMVNRLDGSVGPKDLERGLRCLEQLREQYLEETGAEGKARDEVRAVTSQQQADILIQVLRRGSVRIRMAGAILIPRLLSGFLSAPTLDYLSAKFRYSDG